MEDDCSACHQCGDIPRWKARPIMRVWPASGGMDWCCVQPNMFNLASAEHQEFLLASRQKHKAADARTKHLKHSLNFQRATQCFGFLIFVAFLCFCRCSISRRACSHLQMKLLSYCISEGYAMRHIHIHSMKSHAVDVGRHKVGIIFSGKT